MYHHGTYDVKTMCHIVCITHSLHWRNIKTALQEYVINFGYITMKVKNKNFAETMMSIVLRV